MRRAATGKRSQPGEGATGDVKQWRIRDLLNYCKEHGIEVPEGAEKPVLVELVEDNEVALLLRRQNPKRQEKAAALAGINATTPAAAILRYAPDERHAASLRANPSKLCELVEAGVADLATEEDVCAYAEVAKTPPSLAQWLLLLVVGADRAGAEISALLGGGSSTTCGRVLSSNERVMRCLECSADPTCIFCMECFQRSPCRNHRYTIATSSGGGMCDCGDPTAWKAESFCSKHARRPAGSGGQAEGLDAAVAAWLVPALSGLVALAARACVVLLTTPAKRRPAVSQWVAPWLTAVWDALGLVAATGDAARALVGDQLAAPLNAVAVPPSLASQLCGGPHCSTPELLMECEVVLMKQAYDTPWWPRASHALTVCIANEAFRQRLAAVLACYLEAISAARRQSSLSKLTVQLFTNPDVCQRLSAPSHLPYAGARDTLLHRVQSAMLYSVSVRRPGRTAEGRSSGDEDAEDEDEDKQDASEVSTIESLIQQVPGGGWLVHVCGSVSISAFIDYGYVLANATLGAAATLSRSSVRAMLVSAAVAAVSTMVFRTDKDMVITISAWVARTFNSCLVKWASAVEHTVRCLARGQPVAGGSTGLTTEALAALEESRELDAAPDPRISGRQHLHRNFRQLQAAARVPAGEPAVYPTEAGAGAYAAAVAADVVEYVRVMLGAQRFLFCRGDTSAALHRLPPQPSIPTYDLREPAAHATTFFNSLPAMLAIVLRAWVLNSAGTTTASNGACVRLESAVGSSGGVLGESEEGRKESSGKGPLATVLDAAMPGHAVAEGLLDTLVMPLVLEAQIRQGMWRRNEFHVADLAAAHRYSLSLFGPYNNIFMLQVLTTRLGPEDYALQVLERFSYGAGAGAAGGADEDEEDAEKDNHHDDDETRDGTLAFLRLMLTLQLEDTKCYRDLSHECITRLVAAQLAARRLLHSTIQERLRQFTKGAFADEEACEEGGSGGGRKHTTTIVREVLSKVAVAEQTNNGKAFGIASTAVWKAHVNLFSPLLQPDALEVAQRVYRGVFLRERAEAAKRAGVSLDDSKAPPAPLPPPSFRPLGAFAEMTPSLRALLHTNAVLLPALRVVLTAAARGDDPHSLVVMHAVSVLYLCTRDCEELSAALRLQAHAAEGGGPDDGGGDESAAPPGGIDWDRVETYVKERVKSTATITAASAARVLRLPSLAEPATLQHKLRQAVPPSEMATVLGSTHSSSSSDAPWTPSRALHALRDTLVADAAADIFGVADMIAHVLVAAGLAEFACAAAASPEEALAEEAARTRQQRAKERQAELLRRMRARGARETDAVLGAAAAAAAGAGAGAAAGGVGSVGGHGPAALKPSDVGFLHTALLLSLADAECCVCRMSSEEPLLLLGHASTSGVLNHLGAVDRGLLPYGRRVNSQYTTCGHMVHDTCLKKEYARLASLWQRGTYFQGDRFLGAGELRCPVCVMICNAQSPVPVLAAALTPSETVATTLFEELRRGTAGSSLASGSPFRQPLAEAGRALLTSLANASVGLSVANDDGPVEPFEDELQRADSDAWAAAESVRSALHQALVLLEAVKAGQPLRRQDLLSLLSVLLAVAEGAAPVAGRVLPVLESNGEAAAVLLLRCLLQPAETAALMAAYTRDSVLAVHTAALDAIAAAAAAAVSDDDDDGDGDGGALLERLSGAPAVMALWAALGLPALLKLLLLDDPPGDGMLAVSATGSGWVDFPALGPDGLASGTARIASVTALARYLTGDALPLPLPAAAAAGVVAGTEAEGYCYTDAAEHTRWILSAVLHQPLDYTQLLTDSIAAGVCAQCGCKSEKPVLCLYCNRFYCLQRGTDAELYAHTRECGGGVALYLIVHATSYALVDAAAGRVCVMDPIYVDEYGEPDPSLARGQRLLRDEEAGRRLVRLWLLNRWGVESAIVKRSWRAGVRAL